MIRALFDYGHNAEVLRRAIQHVYRQRAYLRENDVTRSILWSTLYRTSEYMAKYLGTSTHTRHDSLSLVATPKALLTCESVSVQSYARQASPQLNQSVMNEQREWHQVTLWLEGIERV